MVFVEAKLALDGIDRFVAIVLILATMFSVSSCMQREGAVRAECLPRCCRLTTSLTLVAREHLLSLIDEIHGSGLFVMSQLLPSNVCLEVI